MKYLPYIVAALVVWALVQVIVLNVCVSLINARIKELDDKISVNATMIRNNSERMLKLESRAFATGAAITLLNHKLGDPLGKPNYEPTVDHVTGETFPEPNDPENCR